MVLYSTWFAAGLVALYYGAEWLVRGSSRIARSFGISPLVVGLTVVALGTSSPELVVSFIAAFRGEGDVAIGNVVGSNILNLSFILGLCAVIQPIRVDIAIVRREMPVLVATAALTMLLALDGSFSRVDAAILLTGFVAYTSAMAFLARREPAAVQKEYDAFEEARGLEHRREKFSWNLLLVGAGLAGLIAGAHLLVTSAVWFARQLGMSELLVGLTIVAIGTSLPELATSVIAAMRDEAEIALGNVVGSNIFNVLLILGSAAAIQPITVQPSVLRFELPVMIGVSLLVIPFAYSRAKIDRWEGSLLVPDTRRSLRICYAEPDGFAAPPLIGWRRSLPESQRCAPLSSTRQPAGSGLYTSPPPARPRRAPHRAQFADR